MSGENYFNALPRWIGIQFLVDEVLQLLVQPAHKVCLRCAAIGVEVRLRWEEFSILLGLKNEVLGLLGWAEPPASLLVHFGPWCHFIHSKEEHLLRPNDATQALENVDGISFDCMPPSPLHPTVIPCPLSSSLSTFLINPSLGILAWCRVWNHAYTKLVLISFCWYCMFIWYSSSAKPRSHVNRINTQSH